MTRCRTSDRRWQSGAPEAVVDADSQPNLGQRLSSSYRPGLILVLLATALLLLLMSLSDGDPATPPPWYVLLLIFPMLSAFLIGAVLLLRWNDRRALVRNPANRTRQVEELKASLDRAATLASVFRDEIAERDRLLQELEAKFESSRTLAGLQVPEVDAVIEQLRSELRRESRRGLARDVVLGTVFFVAGAVVTRASG
jgi:hypothetical protein